MKRFSSRKTSITLLFLISSLALKAAAPVVSSVTFPAGNYKIGSSIVVTIATDGTGYTVDAGTTINGVDVTGTFASAGGNNYTLTYLVGSGNADRASVAAIPINILIRNGAGAGNLNTYTAAPTSGGSVTIDANAPVILSVTSNATGAGVLKIGQTITFTADIQTTEAGLTLAPTSYNGGTLTWSTANGGDTYTATYTIASGHTDQPTALQLTNVTATDAATNASAPVSGSDVVKTIDANAPVILSVTSNATAAGVLKIGQTITFTADIQTTEAGLTLSPTSYNGGTLTWSTANSGDTYTATYTVASGHTDQPAPLQLTNVTATDAATNTSGAVSGSDVAKTIDANAPVILSVTSDATAAGVLKIGQTITFTADIQTTEPGLTLSPTSYNGGTLTWSTANGGDTYTATYTVVSGQPNQPTALQLPNVTASDAATNASAPVSGSDVVKTIDANPPTLVITRNAVTLGSFAATTDNSISYTLAFSEPINSGTFAMAGDIAVTHGGTTASSGNTLTNPSADNQNFIFTLNSVTGDGTITITVGPAIDDVAGNTMASAQGPSLGFTIDNQAPATPTGIDLVAGSDSGGSSTDNVTNNLTPQFSVGTTEVGATVRIFSTVDAGIRGSAVASGTTTTVNTTLVTQGNGQTHSITAVQTDAAGNPSAASSGLTITLDATAPTVTSASFSESFSHTSDPSFTLCSATTVDKDSNKEFVHLVLSEALNVANGASMPIAGATGFTSSTGALEGCSDRGGTAYHATNTIHLKSNNDGGWSAATTFGFTAGGTVVRDLAGNEMGTFTALVPTDVDAPDLSTGLVFSPNGSSAETITFKFDQALNAAVTTTVTGFTTSAGTIAPGANYNSATRTVTLTSSADGQWTDAVTLAYSLAGNVTDPNNNELAAFGAEPIFLKSVHIQSNNANTARATTGNTITVTFNASRVLASTPVVTIGGLGATVTGGPVAYSASVVTTAVVPETQVAFQIDVAEAIKTTTVTATTDGSSVLFDKTLPSYTSLTIASNGANPVFAKPGENVVITFAVSESLGALPTATIDGKTATVVNTSGLNYTATVTTDNTYNDGVLAFSVSSVDPTGNNGVRTTVTSGSTVTFDKTPPVVASIAGTSTLKGIGSSRGIVATSVDFLVSFTETNVPLSGINANGDDFVVSKDATVNYTTITVAPGAGNTRTVTVSGITGTGKISLGLVDDNTILDGASNPLAGAGDGGVAPAFSGTQYYTIALPEPTNPVASLTAPPVTVTSNSITVQWSQPAAGSQAATHYLVMARPSSGSYPAQPATDGGYVPDGAMAQNIVKGAGTQTAVFGPLPPLSSGTSYDFIIYPYTLGANNNTDNVDFQTSSPATVTAVTNTAALSSMQLNFTPVTIGSLKNSSGNSADVMQFKIFDDGLDPVSPNVMTLQLNGLAQEKIIFRLRDQLTLAEGASVTGFSTSTGSIASAIYSGKGTTNTITLTSAIDGTWTSGTTVSYSSAPTANAVFVTLGKMQAISAHAVAQAPDIVQTFNSDGTFFVPVGVTNITVEAWGAGGAGGSGVGGIFFDAGGGGGGGGYSRSSLAVSPGNSFPMSIGQGGLPVGGFGAPAGSGGQTDFGGLVIANGGAGGFNNVAGDPPGNGGAGAGIGTGTVRFPGGFGNVGSIGNGSFDPGLGGNGGSSAGNASAGTPGSSGGIAPTGGGNGGVGVVNGTGVFGIIPGGAGGGSGNGNGGGGANGRIVVTYSDPTPLSSGTSDWVGDNSPFKFSQLVITQGSGTSAALVGNLDDIIDVNGAELFDGTTTVTGTVGASSITFSSLAPTGGPSDVGVVADANGSASSKTYTLRIWLKDDIDVTNPTLAATIDGMTLDFSVAPANIAYDDATNGNQKSSRLVANQPTLLSGANTVDVDATQLDFSTNPISPVFVSTNVTSVSAAPDLSTRPVVRARDANGNTDKDYSGTLTVTNGGTLPMINNALSMTAGVATFSSTFQYQDAGVGTLTVSDGSLTNGVSSVVAVVYSNTTKISAGNGNEPATFPSTFTSTYAQLAFDFAIDEDNLSGGDGSPTRISQIVITPGAGNDITDWSEALAGAVLYDADFGFFPYPVGTIGTNTITFSGIDFSATNRAGYIADNTRKNYYLYVWFKPALGGTLPSTIDNLNFAFEVLDDNIVTAPLSSTFTGSESANSGSTNNVVTVVATKLQFAVNPAPSLLVGKDISAQLPVPIVEALDVNNNRDLGYNSTTVTVTNSGPLAMSNLPPNGSFTSGLLTFPNNFKFTTTGTGVTLTVASTGTSVVSSTASTAFDVRGGLASTITAGALTEPVTVSSLVDLTHTPAGLPVFDFTINDDPGGTAPTEDDGSPTQLNSLFITSGTGNTVSPWSDAFATATLSDGTNTVTVTTIHSSNYFFFDLSSVTGQALGLIPDGGSKTYTLRVWLKTALSGTLPTTIDGKFFVFDVQTSNITTGANGTKILAGQTQNSGSTNNKVDVNATEINFSQLDGTDNFKSPYADANFPSSGSIFSDFVPRLGVEAHDANKNRDLDFTGSITSFAPVTAGVTTQNDPSGAFIAGTLKFPTNFNYVTGNNQDGMLRISAGGISNQDSPSINIISSFESQLVSSNATVPLTQDIDFINYQAADITTTSATTTNGFTLDLLNLYDGGVDRLDADGAATSLDDLTLGLSNWQSIRRIAIYSRDPVTGNVTEVKDFDITDAALTPTTINGYRSITFTDLNITAPDNTSPANLYTQILVLATFQNTPATITDRDNIRVAVLGATLNAGSKFAPNAAQTGTIGGVATSSLIFPETSIAATVGTVGYLSRLQVTATSLDFVTQATTTSPYAGIDEPVGNTPPSFTVPYVSSPLPSTGASIVFARDKFANLDTDFNGTPTITQTAGPNTPVAPPRNFVNGILRLDGMEYQSTGDGTLKVVANGIDSSNPPGANTLAIPGGPINVVNVIASLQPSGVLEGTGIPATYSIKGGSLDQTIFGVTFTASGATASEPMLKKFSISFDKSFHVVNGGVITDIFTNFRVLRGPTDITSLGGVLNYSLSSGSSDGPGSQDIIIVDLTSSPQPLFNGPVSYYLVADVDPTANLSTPSLTPRIIDNGYGTTTDANIIVSQGTASGTVTGNLYTFASTKPPILKTAKGTLVNPSSSPYAGQLNVDAGLTQIKLQFDVAVTSLDGGLNNGAELYNRTTNVKVADLKAVSGLGNYLSTNDEKQVINPLTFDLNFVSGQSLQADEVYYVVIKKGSFDPISLKGTGISDQGLNFFGGISSNAILYFKIASDKPLKLVDIESTFNNKDIGTLSTEFDQFGTAYYLVVPAGSTAPTNAQVRTPSTYLSAPKAAFGNYTIDRINALQTVSFPANYALGLSYDIYVYAENDAPSPVPSGPSVPNPSGGVYGTNKVAGSGGYTLRITLPLANVVTNKPDYLICPSSFVTLSEPIIIGESTNTEFSSTSLQNFNILLPTGYEFDVLTYPSVNLIGGDFNNNIATMNFVSNTVLNISYVNNPNPILPRTTDYILISNLRIRGAAGSTNQQILRFYGTNTLTPPVTSIGTVGLIPTEQFNFTNSYSETNKPFPLPSPIVVNSIPDNYTDSDPTIAGSIRLNPIISVLNDYNGSIFSGTGVTNDLLTLSAVPNNSAFNITMLHTDPNGCVSQKSQQYLVYDHRSSISKKLGTAYPLTPQEGTAQALVNVNFPLGNSPVIASPTIVHNELAGYRLINLSADLPASEIRLNANGGRSQIISGSTWRTIVKNVTLIPPTLPVLVDLGTLGTYYNYTWDYSHILNAASSGITVNPYDGEIDTDPNSITGFLFRKSSGRNTYWTGGSLGKVEFTGVYRSSADLTVIMPFRQQVELFVPPVPVVEVGVGNQTTLDKTDPLNPVSSSNAGTPIFCEQGGAIAINGFPAASATATGVFDITTLAGTPILHNPLSFVDNGNGTATLYPYLISGGVNVGFNNGYKDFKITYRFQENNSPAFGTSSITIRVSANPVAKFVQASDLTAGSMTLGKASSGTAYCAGIPIIFDPLSSTIAADAIASFDWKFGDGNSANNVASSTIGSPSITNDYPTIGTYRAELSVKSDMGCLSINTDNFADITVGSIPTFSSVAFDLVGISKADQITFADKTTAASNTSNSFSSIANVVWNYGDGVTDALATHKYSAAGHYTVKSTVTTAIRPTITGVAAPGCVRSFDRHILILDKQVGTYVDDFETVSKVWLSIKDSLDVNGTPLTTTSVAPSSWKRGMPATNRSAINSTPITGSANSNIWATGLTGSFAQNERSFLYSPVIDMAEFVRPMISFDANWDLVKDGVVLEYSTDTLNVADPSKKWTALGGISNGVKWFNDQVIGSKPGEQPSADIGWSKTSKDDDHPTGWVESKNELSTTIKGTRAHVVFRFGFASTNNIGDGFAIDNFRIGERTRTILLEKFTSTNGMDATQNSAIISENDFASKFQIDALNATTVVRLNYHIGFTRTDPFNMDNPADPSARALYYNINDVPRVFLDGIRPLAALLNAKFESWGLNQYNSQTLQLGQANIDIPTVTTNADGSIKFNVEVTALYDLPANTVVHVAIIEKSVLTSGLPTPLKNMIQAGTNEATLDYVLKKMLPNALGTKLGTPLAKNQKRTFNGFEYYPDPVKLYNNNNDLAVIVFLQNENDKEVYQTYITPYTINDPPTVTGIEEPAISLEDIVLFPNPADDEFTVQLPVASKTATRLRLADQVGKVVYDAFIPAGSTEKKINTQDMAAGMYFLQVDAEKGGMTRKKVLVVHNK